MMKTFLCFPLIQPFQAKMPMVNTQEICEMREIKKTPRLILLLFVAVSHSKALPGPAAPDFKIVPAWHRAVVYIQVPTRKLLDGTIRHYTEHCTAVAVRAGPNPLYVSA